MNINNNPQKEKQVKCTTISNPVILHTQHSIPGTRAYNARHQVRHEYCLLAQPVKWHYLFLQPVVVLYNASHDCVCTLHVECYFSWRHILNTTELSWLDRSYVNLSINKADELHSNPLQLFPRPDQFNLRNTTSNFSRVWKRLVTTGPLRPH